MNYARGLQLCLYVLSIIHLATPVFPICPLMPAGIVNIVYCAEVKGQNLQALITLYCFM